MPPNQIPKKEIPFPHDSVEATTPNYFKRRRLTRSDVGMLHVLVMCLFCPSPFNVSYAHEIWAFVTWNGTHHAESQTKITSVLWWNAFCTFWYNMICCKWGESPCLSHLLWMDVNFVWPSDCFSQVGRSDKVLELFFKEDIQKCYFLAFLNIWYIIISQFWSWTS